MTKPRAILFDKDGTLLDFEATWGPATAAVIAALAEGEDSRVEALAEACGFDIRSLTFDPSSPIIAGDTNAFAPRWAELLKKPFDSGFAERVDRLYRRESLASLTGYEDVAPGLDELLARGVPVGLATNDSEVTARAHLEAFGIAHHFVFIAGYDSGFGGKPAPGMVEAFARRIDAPCGEVAVVGDSAHDMAAARTAGALAVGMARTRRARAALEGLADVTVEDLPGLHRYLAHAGDA